MRVNCLHGYFIFDETTVGQISDFMSLTGFTLVRKGLWYTFSALEAAPDYSLAGKAILGTPATKTFTGEPWDVFRANGIAYDFAKGQVVPLNSITQTVKISLAGNRFISNGLILPGSLTAEGKRVTDYSAWLTRGGRWLYSEVAYV